MDSIFKFICCGNVDDGKSTLIGRLLLDTDNVTKDQLMDAKKASIQNGSKKTQLSMLLDGLISERQQQITIDIAHRYFDYNNIRFHILDCPGHEQYTKNMATAAAQADSAIVVVDVTKGISEQTKKHIEICSFFNLKNICICLTKCDLITDNSGNLDLNKADKVSNSIKELIKPYNFNYSIIPISSITRFNIDKVLDKICLYAQDSRNDINNSKARIVHIQNAKMYDRIRYYWGKSINNTEPEIEKTYTLYPSKALVTISKIVNHGCFNIKENIDISKGDCISDYPVIISNIIKHKTIWFDEPTDDMLLKHGTRIAHIMCYNNETIELDDDIIFNNIEDVKQNGFGILIDNITKKTIGCSVFTGN